MKNNVRAMKTDYEGCSKNLDVISEFGRLCGVKRRKPGFPLQSFLPLRGKKGFPLQSLARAQRLCRIFLEGVVEKPRFLNHSIEQAL
ncbi:MAG: hypothetical protein LBK13_06420 [Spirochaetales bacterium]|jgi:hypothetical protein|nr:hypothetical protein [Spirochaetales bacterium]